MSFAPFVLVVSAAFIHAFWNLLSKRSADAGPSFVFAYNLICCVAYAPWVVWLGLHDEMPRTWPAAIGIVLSGLVHLAYSLCLQRGYQVADLSVVYPTARGTGPLLSSFSAFLLLGEKPTSLKVIGLFGVVAGIGLIATQGDLTAFRRPGGQAGVRWGIGTGALIASYTVVDAYVVKDLGVHPVILDWCSNLLRFVLLAPLVLRNPDLALARMAGRWHLVVAVGLLSPLSYIFVLLALDMGAPLSVVAPAREMSMMVGALLGMLVLHEAVGRWRLVGCLVLVLGVVLLRRS
ncbi:EamA family transporter [Methylobacterium sp. NPDC080182]|uniref:EamA family transporter n=1 Tax=Methylobacterium sp. NPDC080182 TaxID=3390590 RepID=UPI003CFD5406